MTLTNLTEFPPNGYLYREPSLNWEAPGELALQGLDAVASALSVVRANNPASGLNPDFYACVEAVKAYTCARFVNKPKALARFCGGVPEPTAQEAATLRTARGTGKGCAGCGRRRK